MDYSLVNNTYSSASLSLANKTDQLFSTPEEEKKFLKGPSSDIYESAAIKELRLIVREHREVIPVGVRISNLEEHLIMPSDSTDNRKILLELGILKEEKLRGIKLTLAHEEHLLSHGVILWLAAGNPVDLNAFSRIPKKHIGKGIIETIQEQLTENSDKTKKILEDMEASGLFVNIHSEFSFGTPLHRAVFNKDTEMVNVLLKYGAAASLDLRDENGYTPLVIAELNGYQKIEKILDAAKASLRQSIACPPTLKA